MCRAVGSSDQSNSYRSPTAWLADVAREGFGQCKGTLRLAERIVHMPRVQASFGNGAIPEAALRLLTDSWAGCHVPAPGCDAHRATHWLDGGLHQADAVHIGAIAR
ncbi:hypothetical protein [uncultured Ilumatobacter sp.]|jgi:hypothetical protein|uniref:hypothetical protein n=1 Tax=Ilumatobacter sp. TaxID=1967498 RepID=UPI00309842E1|tara:strand:+ start:3938 stop:4255 length:318 start_codon:yes stop_codon:yes gene_type:complete